MLVWLKNRVQVLQPASDNGSSEFERKLSSVFEVAETETCAMYWDSIGGTYFLGWAS